jgi:hypothetical protein
MPRANAEHTTSAPHLNGARPPKSRRKPLRINRQRIQRMEAIVEGLLRLLDEVEGDVDTEDNGDAEPEESGYGDEDGMSVEQDGEPSLGWTDYEARYGRYADQWGYATDGEEEHDGREPDCDDEEDDPGEDNGDAEPEASDYEPSLCAVTVDREHAVGMFNGIEPVANKRRRHWPGNRLLDYDPRNLSPTYVLMIEGNCMAPDYPDGAKLRFDQAQRPQPGDLVAVFFQREKVRQGEHQVLVKRLASAIPQEVTFPYADPPGSGIARVVMFEMNNPPRRFAVMCRDLLAVHKCLGVAEPGASRPMTGRERAQLRVSKGMPAI